MTSWCPFCWDEVSVDAPRCSDCGADLRDLSYEKKAALALRHPIRENRMIAVEVLRLLRVASAVPDLVRALQRETDFYFLREVLRALRAIHTPESDAALRRATLHDSPLVASTARQVLEQEEHTRGAP